MRFIRSRLVIRIVLLLACLGGGVTIGFVGQRHTGDAAWYLAIPGLLAIAWLFVADPALCIPRRDGPGPGGPLQGGP